MTNRVARVGTCVVFMTVLAGCAAAAEPALAPNRPATQSIRCAPIPSRCGLPDATNTGPPDGTALVRVPADVRSGEGWVWSDTYDRVRVTGPGSVLDGLDISGSVVIDAPDVTLSRSRIAACGGPDDGDVVSVRYSQREGYQASGARIIGNEIQGSPPDCDHRSRSGVRDTFGEAPGLLVVGNDISGVANGITVEFDAVVTDNWVHDLAYLRGDHNSGISTHGGALQITIKNNTVLLYGKSMASADGVSAAVTIYSDFDRAQNVTVEHNLLSGGAYTVLGGNSGAQYNAARPATNIRIRSNLLVCGQWVYGPVALFNVRTAGNQWRNNRCDQTGRLIRP